MRKLAWERYDASNATRDPVTGWVKNCWVLDREATAKNWAEAEVKGGVVRWKSNGAVPPDDCLNSFEAIGCRFDRKATDAAYQRDLDRSIREYRDSRKNYVPSDEEMYEMRAAFGPGTVVVDVVTGRKVRV